MKPLLSGLIKLSSTAGRLLTLYRQQFAHKQQISHTWPASLVSNYSTMSGPARRKVVLDVDTGIDDAHAIMLALSHSDVDVIAITCANGNVKIDDVTANTLRVLTACDRLDVPVYKGAFRSLLGQVSTFDNFNAPAWRTPVDVNHVKSERAANALVRLAREHPGEITLVAVAPLTNIALAVNLDPAFPKNLRDVIIMGGNTDIEVNNIIGDGNCLYRALSLEICSTQILHEDIKALTVDFMCRNHEVFGRYVGQNLGEYLGEHTIHQRLWETDFEDFMETWTSQDNKKSAFLRDSLEFSIKDAKTSGRPGYRTCDGFAMAAVLDKQVVTKVESVHATVELNGQFTRGQMVVDWNKLLKKSENISLIQGLDVKRLEEVLFKIVQP